MDTNLRYFVAKPSKTRKTFVLVCYSLQGRRRIYHKLAKGHQAAVTKLNKQLLAKVLTADEVATALEDLRQSIYRKGKIATKATRDARISEINHKVFEAFWGDVYAVRSLEDEKSPRYNILKALRLIEPLSISTASQQELVAHLRKQTRNAAEYRQTVNKLNQLLRYLGRDFKLSKPKQDLVKVQYLTLPELQTVLGKFDDDVLRDLAMALFATGCRLSEALALEPQDFDATKNMLHIYKQLPADGTLKAPKRNSLGWIKVLRVGLPELQRWLEVPNKPGCRYRLYDALVSACQKAFPDNRAKWVGPHDLRHSHAIYWLGKGVNLKQVALNLRNHVNVCEKYYTGFAHTDGTLDALDKYDTAK